MLEREDLQAMQALLFHSVKYYISASNLSSKGSFAMLACLWNVGFVSNIHMCTQFI